MDEYYHILKEKFKFISHKIYNILEVFDSENCNIRQVNEDGISSIILKELAKLRGLGFDIKVHSLEVREFITGMDYDIWIGENNNEYIRLNVQAKSLLNGCHTTDSYSINKEQCNKLISHSSKVEHSSIPLYFFYQHINDENLKNTHFRFLLDFMHEDSSITYTSAHNILSKLNNSTNSLTFESIHFNNIDEIENNLLNIFLDNNEYYLGLPFYTLYDLTPSKVRRFNEEKNRNRNANGFLYYYFYFLNNDPIKIHKITSEQIIERYGKNDEHSEIKTKNLIIINDANYKQRKRHQKLIDLLK